MTTHGLCRRSGRHPLYKTWVEMLYRCENPRKHNYKHYGGRGIKVCERWHDIRNFIADMGDRPQGKTLDRIDVNGNYEPSNCRWASRTEQMNNTSTNRIICVDGRNLTMAQASREFGPSIGLIWMRLKSGWSDADAAKIPPRSHKAYTRSQQANMRATKL